MKTDEQGEVRNAVILGYRHLINKRYDFEILKQHPNFPASFTEERIERFKAYFLDNIYPLPEKRDDLEAAFNSLDEYIKQPEKLLRIAIDSGSIIFKFGRHLPKILKAGVQALSSFRTASKFENKLVEVALNSNYETPFDTGVIEELIRKLSKQEIDGFINSSQNLLELLHDRVLISKIKEIVDHLIAKMKKRSDVYSEAEITGLEIGKDVIINGDNLFNELAEDEQKNIFKLIVQVEREYLNSIFNSKN